MSSLPEKAIELGHAKDYYSSVAKKERVKEEVLVKELRHQKVEEEEIKKEIEEKKKMYQCKRCGAKFEKSILLAVHAKKCKKGE